MSTATARKLREPLTVAAAIAAIRGRTAKAGRTIDLQVLTLASHKAEELGVVAVTAYISCDGLEGLRRSFEANGYRPSLYYRDGVARATGDASSALAAAIVLEQHGMAHWQA